VWDWNPQAECPSCALHCTATMISMSENTNENNKTINGKQKVMIKSDISSK
jgi:hypothetical protein